MDESLKEQNYGRSINPESHFNWELKVYEAKISSDKIDGSDGEGSLFEDYLDVDPDDDGSSSKKDDSDGDGNPRKMNLKKRIPLIQWIQYCMNWWEISNWKNLV